MDSFNQTNGFRYNPNSNSEGDSDFSGFLEIYVHHARNIHNICIYDNQDVYAKFSLTYNPDETLSTRIVNGGGKNPDFNENLAMKVTQFDSNLKCEIWMLSRAKNLMEDQLLGFALVPISSVVGKGKVTEDFSLSSTDLFHSPAGTVKLSLTLTTICTNSVANSSFKSISSEVVLLDRKISEVVLDPVEYSRIEFPDINAVRENQQMVSEYFDIAGKSHRPSGLLGSGSFLHLGASSQNHHHPVDDYEMTANSSDENLAGSVSPNDNSGFFGSTMTSLSDDRNSGDSLEKKVHVSITTEANPVASVRPETPTSKKKNDEHREQKEEERNNEGVKFGKVFSAPLGNNEAEQSAMQQQIVDMYMRSMQQFTESLAKMKLPMDLDKPEAEDSGIVIQTNNNNDSNNNNNNNSVEVDKKRKDSSRVFYGSRAFF